MLRFQVCINLPVEYVLLTVEINFLCQLRVNFLFQFLLQLCKERYIYLENN